MTNYCKSIINQEQKLGDRRWLDTIVVLTINYADKGLAVVVLTPSAPYEKSQVFGFRGEYGRKAET